MRTKEEELAFEQASYGNKGLELILKLYHDGRSKDPKKLTSGLVYEDLLKKFGITEK